MNMFLSRLLNHKFMFSMALSETGAVRGVSVRAIFPILLCSVLVGGIGTLIFAKDTVRTKLVATVAGDDKLLEYAAKIEQLEREKLASRKEVETVAKAVGVLQARYERFDHMADKLLGNERLGPQLEKDIPPSAGGPGEFQFDTLPTVNDLAETVGLMKANADHIDTAFSAGLAQIVLANNSGSHVPFYWPVLSKKQRVSSPYGWRIHPVTKRRSHHDGLDIAAPIGKAVVSSADGQVTFVGWRMGYGLLMEVKHGGGFMTRYAHLHKATKPAGSVVEAGELIALLGNTGRSTGPHLHFEIHKDGQHFNPYPFIRDHRTMAEKLSKDGLGQRLVGDWRESQKLANK